jgi:hypothetical protein
MRSFKSKLNINSPRALAISKAIGQFIVVDMRPYSMVESVGFKQLISILEPRYEMPSRPYLSDKIVPDLYQKTRESVIHELKQAQYVSVTTDGWTSSATESYITITVHYLVDWQIRSKVLQTRQLIDAHNAENIADVMKLAMDEWKIVKPSITIPITTDNAQNVKSVQIAGFWQHIRCFAHCLNLAIHVVSRLLGRVKRIVTFFMLVQLLLKCLLINNVH